MLIKLQFDEIVGQDASAYDIYDSQGTLLLKAGDPVVMNKLASASHHGLFRPQDKLPLEWISRHEMPDIDTAAVRQIADSQTETEVREELNLPYLLDRNEAVPYLACMFGFWKKLEEKEEADIAMLEILEHELVSAVVSKIDQLEYLNQLRIRDGITYSHTLDVTSVSIAIGVKLGLSNEAVKRLALGALLHDLGKLFIPKPIMFKEKRLNNDEFDVMQLHPELGYRVIRDELGLDDDIARPALEHQELWAGGGYPQSLQGDQIHEFSQIVKVADVYDALTSRRPYKDAICSRKAIKIMLLEGPASFNPEVLEALMALANYTE
ncbi:MAG: HD domain-containing protein [Cyanobacteria bacterium HKST-UBA06]|nr:HD domain-containing protein [Cyanobacteria bacterium HKST-UBA06]MCA9841063.1 HD domain-containing protein [Cyanobacteria bacterium HKST-UBA03]